MIGHDELQASIPALAAGRLDGEDRRLLEAHLETCASCRAVLATAREIAATLGTDGKTLLSPHPEVTDLHGYALGRARTATDDTIGAHVKGCASCALEVAAWHRRSKERTRRRAVVWPLGAGGAIAAGLLLWLWLGPARGPESLGPQVITFAAAFRGAETEYVISVDPDRQLVISVEWEPLDDVGSVACEIVRPDGQTAWRSTLPADRVEEALRAGNGLSVAVPAGTLEPGAYEWRMSWAARPTEPPLMLVGFQVRKQP